MHLSDIIPMIVYHKHLQINAVVAELSSQENAMVERVDAERQRVANLKASITATQAVIDSERAAAQRIHVARMAELAGFATKLK